MANTIPLIRGFALFPTLGWFARRGLISDDVLLRAGLPPDLSANPFRPIPLVFAAGLLRMAAREIGPDLPCRIIAEADTLELAMLGKIGLGARTPREALARIIASLPYYCSHEHVSMEKTRDGTVVREFFSHKFEPETQHLLLQYAAAMVDRIISMCGPAERRFVRLELPPHPKFGLTHLADRFGPGLAETKSRGFAMLIEDRILDHAFISIGRDRTNGRQLPIHEPLRGDGTLSCSVRTLLASMSGDGMAIPIEFVVAAAGTRLRTFQRQLEAEGTNFSKLLAETHLSEAQKRLHDTDVTIASIAEELGYADQASFTRAFRKWTGRAPREFRMQRVS